MRKPSFRGEQPRGSIAQKKLSDRSLRIVLLIRSLSVGGAQTQLVLLAIGLKQKGHEVTVALFYDQGEMRQGLAEAGVELVSLEKRGDGTSFRFLQISTCCFAGSDLMFFTAPNSFQRIIPNSWSNFLSA